MKLILLVLLFSCFNISLGISQVDYSYSSVEEMPRFPACENINNAVSRQSCADKKLLEYIFNNVVFPENETEFSERTTIVIGFVVTKEGILENIEVIRGINASYDEAILNVMHSLNTLEQRWIPGKHQEEPVSVKMTLPIRFEFDKNE